MQHTLVVGIVFRICKLWFVIDGYGSLMCYRDLLTYNIKELHSRKWILVNLGSTCSFSYHGSEGLYSVLC